MLKPANFRGAWVPRSGMRMQPLLLFTGVVVVALLFGFMIAAYPPSFSAKAAALLIGPVALLFGLFSARFGQTTSDGHIGRALMGVWAFLLGSCPVYVPFKFGALPGLNPLRLVYAAIIVGWLYSLITSAQLRAALRARIAQSRTVFTLISALLVWQFFCAVVGSEPFFSLYLVVKVMLPSYLLYLVAMTYLRDWRDLQRFAFALVLGAIVACGVGIAEWRTQTNIFLSFLPTSAEDSSGLEWILVDKSRGGDYRVSATFAHPLVLGEFICMVLPFVLALAITAAKRWHRAVAIAALPLFVLMVYLSYTRSSLIASLTVLMTMGVLFGIRAARQTRRAGLAMLGWMVLITVVSTAVGLASSVGYLAQGRTAAEAGSSMARVEMLSRGARLVADQPIQGYGPGMGASKIGLLPGQRNLTIDSYFLSLAIETGIVGLVLFVSALVLVLWRTARTALESAGQESWFLIALTAAVLASLIVKLVLSLGHNVDLLYLLIGMGTVATSLAPRVEVAKSHRYKKVWAT